MHNQDPVEMVQEKAILVYNYFRLRTAQALAVAKERGLLQDRDVQIAAGGFLLGWFLLSFGTGFGLAAGYLGYHYIRFAARLPAAKAPAKKAD